MLRLFGIAMIVLLALDAVQLYVNANYHSSIFQKIQKSSMQLKIFPAFLVYVLLSFSIIYFVIMQSKNIQESFQKGAILGLITFGVYDLTNLATLNAWTNELAIIDMIWGTILCSVTSGVVYYFK